MTSRLLVVALALISGCGDDPEPAAPPPCLEGSCLAGVLPELCGAGFMADGDHGCEPILPPERCPPGSLAVPGETACHEVAGCADGTWGDIPVDASSEHVDASYPGGDSDGTAARPWTSIVAAVAAAAPGAIVAVAAGSYAEDVVLSGKPVRLWGRCPAMVAIAGTGVELGAVVVMPGAAGAELRSLALTGSGMGVTLSGATNVLVERVWVHDTAWYGVGVEGTLGTTSATVRSSLIEQGRAAGLFANGAELLVEATTVRGNLPHVQGLPGRGVNVEATCVSGACVGIRGTLSVQGSLIEDNRGSGIYVAGSDALIENTVVRGTLVEGLDPGTGVAVQLTVEAAGSCDPSTRADASIRSSLIEDSHTFGVYVGGADARLESTVVRRTSPNAGEFGYGLEVVDCGCKAGCSAAARAEVALVGSLIEDSNVAGVLVADSDVTIEKSLVRRTLPNANGFGDGIALTVRGSASVSPSLHMTESRIEESARAGLSSFGASVTVGDVALQCSGFDLESEAWPPPPAAGLASQFEVIAPNHCGCPEADADCVVRSYDLVPPDPL